MSKNVIGEDRILQFLAFIITCDIISITDKQQLITMELFHYLGRL